LLNVSSPKKDMSGGRGKKKKKKKKETGRKNPPQVHRDRKSMVLLRRGERKRETFQKILKTGGEERKRPGGKVSPVPPI